MVVSKLQSGWAYVVVWVGGLGGLGNSLRSKGGQWVLDVHRPCAETPAGGPSNCGAILGWEQQLVANRFCNRTDLCLFLETNIFFRLLEHRSFKKHVLKSQSPRLPKPPTHTTNPYHQPIPPHKHMSTSHDSSTFNLVTAHWSSGASCSNTVASPRRGTAWNSPWLISFDCCHGFLDFWLGDVRG